MPQLLHAFASLIAPSSVFGLTETTVSPVFYLMRNNFNCILDNLNSTGSRGNKIIKLLIKKLGGIVGREPPETIT